MEKLLVLAWGVNKAVLGGLWSMSLCPLLTFLDPLALLPPLYSPPIAIRLSCGLTTFGPSRCSWNEGGSHWQRLQALKPHPTTHQGVGGGDRGGETLSSQPWYEVVILFLSDLWTEGRGRINS